MSTQSIDVRDMAIIHRTFRNMYGESARLVRAAPTRTWATPLYRVLIDPDGRPANLRRAHTF